MKFLKYLLYLLAFIAGIFLLFLLYSMITDYRPADKEILFSSDRTIAAGDSVFSAVIWNIGYAGLDASMDFFYDGGKKVRPGEEQLDKNLEGILEELENYRQYDFLLLQEVDRLSKRSYKRDMYDMIGGIYEDYHAFFGINYDVAFVPLPPAKPMGTVLSGLMTLTRETPAQVIRYSFPGNYTWPVSLFMLDRCYMESRMQLDNGKDLVVINTHNSAYDDGSLRARQMDHMKTILLKEYEMGNYVIVGGDWNQTPFGFEPRFAEDVFDREDLTFMEEGYPAENWTWAYDDRHPTNRRVNSPYEKGLSSTTLIDCFLLSPNLELIEVNGKDLNFQFSDHQPVRVLFRIK